MSLIDLPLAELHRFPGRNPRPADFDRFWAEARAELDRTPPNAELKAARVAVPTGIEAFDLWFTGVGGARIYAKFLQPTGVVRAPAILQFHGYTAHSGDWFDKLGWPAAGFCWAGLDCRGQGGRSEDGICVKGTTLRGHIIRGLDDPDPAKLAFRQLFLDTVQLARVVMDMPGVDPDRLGCCGWSQGGGLALACAALEPRIRRCMVVYPFLCDYRRVWEMDLARDAYFELAYFFRMFDPRHVREDEIFTKLGYIDCQHLAPRIKGQVLMLTGLMDTVCPPSSQFAAYNKIAAPKEVVIYPDFAHEALPGQHDTALEFFQKL